MRRLPLFFLLMSCQEYILEGEPDPEPSDTDVAPVDTDEPPPVPTDAPIAECEASTYIVAPPFDTVTFDGSASYDPNGLSIVNYDWRITARPHGSTVAMPAGDAIRTGFAPDLAGSYTARLVVENSAGVLSNACELQIEAVPTEDLWIEMVWDQDGDDMDLHLLRPGGTMNGPGDCYYSNCVGGGLDWGVPGNTADDPRLDLDDIEHTGPENINLDQPAPGVYRVMVFDYGEDPGIGATTVTVNIYLNASLAWTDTRTFTGDLTENYFAEIDWQSQTITSL